MFFVHRSCVMIWRGQTAVWWIQLVSERKRSSHPRFVPQSFPEMCKISSRIPLKCIRVFCVGETAREARQKNFAWLHVILKVAEVATSRKQLQLKVPFAYCNSLSWSQSGAYTYATPRISVRRYIVKTVSQLSSCLSDYSRSSRDQIQQVQRNFMWNLNGS